MYCSCNFSVSEIKIKSNLYFKRKKLWYNACTVAFKEERTIRLVRLSLEIPDSVPTFAPFSSLSGGMQVTGSHRPACSGSHRQPGTWTGSTAPTQLTPSTLAHSQKARLGFGFSVRRIQTPRGLLGKALPGRCLEHFAKTSFTTPSTSLILILRMPLCPTPPQKHC